MPPEGSAYKVADFLMPVEDWILRIGFIPGAWVFIICRNLGLGATPAVVGRSCCFYFGYVRNNILVNGSSNQLAGDGAVIYGSVTVTVLTSLNAEGLSFSKFEMVEAKFYELVSYELTTFCSAVIALGELPCCSDVIKAFDD